jgi:asparagine N-glycosylation enzyme membrane subunit Stt3
VFQWSRVFTDSHVSFQGGDAWYHMRLVDHMLRNFPHRTTVDPYLGYPDPVLVAVAPFFDMVVAASAWLVGVGAPSQSEVDVVGALLPPVLGAATIIPVYALGARLFDRRAGLVAAALLAVMPGNFLDRGQLGYADHHVLEVLLSLLTLLALAIASTSTRGRAYRLAVGGPRVLPLGVLALAAAGVGVLIAIRPALVTGLLDDLRRLAPGRAEQTVAEVRPLLRMMGPLSLRPLAEEFGSTFLVGLVGLGQDLRGGGALTL